MTVTITPTVDLTSIPPSVQLAVLDSTGANTSLTVQRMDPDGVLRPVRTTDGNALPLTVSGATKVGSVIDYEPWYGQSVYYTTAEVPSVTSVSVTVNEDRIWLTHPGVPSLSMPVELRIGSLDVVEFGVARSVFRPQGRRFPVVQTAGTRYAGASTLIVTMESTQEWDALQALLDDASTLLLNSSPANGLNIPTNYISIDTVRLRRPAASGPTPCGTSSCRSTRWTGQLVVRVPLGPWPTFGTTSRSCRTSATPSRRCPTSPRGCDRWPTPFPIRTRLPFAETSGSTMWWTPTLRGRQS
jgi:hypothetical protein